MKLRPYQLQKSQEVAEILLKRKIVYLAGEVRSGKTRTALNAATLFGAKGVLFVTKKKAIPSIEFDYNELECAFNLDTINYESLHKVSGSYDLIIYDEAHSLGAFPKPSKRVKLARQKFYNIPCILMSGTPAVESYSQLFHQFHVSAFSPFATYSNFYRWAKDFVNVKKKRIGTHEINDYSNANVRQIDSFFTPLKVVMTQDGAGIETNVAERFLEVDVPDAINKLATRLIDDRVIEGKEGVVFGDTPAKLQGKVHQIYNGTVIIETYDDESEAVILSDYKARYIYDYFKGKKLAIMYYYQAELELLKQVFGESITDSIDEFNSSSKSLAIQQSSTEGINLSRADCIVFYNFGFSGKNYLQSRDRLTVKGREDNTVYFVIEKGGITEKILRAVKNKKDYNSRAFIKDFVHAKQTT